MDEGFSKISIICLLGALLLDQGAHLLDEVGSGQSS